MLRTLMVRNLALLTSPSRLWLVLLGYTALLMVLRLVFILPGSQDDSEQLIVAQYLAGGYTPSQPPLYTWMVIAAQTVVGPSVLSVVLVKYACQFATFAFMYLGARRALEDERLAALAAVSLVAVYYIGWETVFNFSHTPLWAAAMTATFHALMCVRDERSSWAYGYLGLAIGVGMLSKYGYFVSLGGFAGACLIEPTIRRALVDRRFLLTVAAAALVVLPHGVWLASGAVDLVTTMHGRLTVNPEWSYWDGVGNGLYKLARAVIGFFFPLYLLLLVLFPGAWRSRLAERHPIRRFVAVSALAGLAIVLVGIIGFGVTTFRTDYAIVFLPMVIYCFLRIEAVGTSARKLAPFALALSALALVVVVGVPVRALSEPQYCRKCYFNMPYPALADEMRAAGFERGTVVTHFHRIQIGGNLKIQFPDSRVISSKYAFAVPPPVAEARQCLLVWDTSAGDGMPEDLRRFARRVVGLSIPEEVEAQYAEARLRFAVSRTERLGFVLLEDGCQP